MFHKVSYIIAQPVWNIPSLFLHFFHYLTTFFDLISRFRDFSSWNQIQETWNRSHDNCFLPEWSAWSVLLIWEASDKVQIPSKQTLFFFPEMTASISALDYALPMRSSLFIKALLPYRIPPAEGPLSWSFCLTFLVPEFKHYKTDSLYYFYRILSPLFVFFL